MILCGKGWHKSCTVHVSAQGIYPQVQARGAPKEDDPTIAGHLLRLRDSEGRPLSQERLHAEFSVMFIGGAPCFCEQRPDVLLFCSAFQPKNFLLVHAYPCLNVNMSRLLFIRESFNTRYCNVQALTPQDTQSPTHCESLNAPRCQCSQCLGDLHVCKSSRAELCHLAVSLQVPHLSAPRGGSKDHR